MSKPLVAVIGRPNVGKSTFFNKMAGRRISIVNDMRGVTRDRVYADVDWCGKSFTMIDTGGIELKSDDKMWRFIREQAELAVELADVIVFFVDGVEGILPDDYDIADYLRQSKKPIVLAVNKIDNREQEQNIFDFYALGLGEPIPVSSELGRNTGDLLDEITQYLPTEEQKEEEDAPLKIAVVGKPNAGKSSIVNKILGYDRVIVSDIAGTTRDAIDTPFRYNGKDYVIIDTAGIRRKSKVEEAVEYYSVLRSIRAIENADIVFIVIDSSGEISEQDVKIAAMAHEAGKPSVVVMNKWDLVEKDTHTINRYNDKLKEALKFMDYFKPVYVSALTGQRLTNILEEGLKSYERASFRISTGTLNEIIGEAVAVNEPPMYKGKRLKIYYSTQAATNPPTFVLFVNEPTAVHFSYRRYLENCIRKSVDFSGTPIKIIIKSKEKEEA